MGSRGRSEASAAPRALRYRRLGELAVEDARLKWVVEGLWPEGSFGVVGGPPKSCKSLLMIDAAVAVAAGQPFLGRSVPSPGPVALYNGEDAISLVGSRLARILDARGLDRSALPLYLIDEPAVHLDRRADVDALRSFVREVRPRLLVIDCLRRVMTGAENDSGTVARILGALREMCRESGCAIALVHHLDKGARGLRGSGELLAAGDTYWFVRPDRPGVQRLNLVLRAARVQESIDFCVTGDEDEPLRVDVAPPDDRDRRLDERVLAALDEVDGPSVRQLYDLVPGRRAEVDESRRRLVEQGKATTQLVGRKVVTRRIVLADDPVAPPAPVGSNGESPATSTTSASPPVRETMGDGTTSPDVSAPAGDDDPE